MDELRAYCEIPDDIDVMLSDGPTRNTVGGDDNAVFFTREQLAAGLRFPVPTLVKKFLHFTRAPLALVHPNVIRILTGCCCKTREIPISGKWQNSNFVYKIVISVKNPKFIL